MGETHIARLVRTLRQVVLLALLCVDHRIMSGRRIYALLIKWINEDVKTYTTFPSPTQGK